MKSYNLYIAAERDNGTLLRQRVCKVKDDISHEEIHKRIADYKKILGKSYYIVDWYIDV